MLYSFLGRPCNVTSAVPLSACRKWSKLLAVIIHLFPHVSVVPFDLSFLFIVHRSVMHTCLSRLSSKINIQREQVTLAIKDVKCRIPIPVRRARRFTMVLQMLRNPYVVVVSVDSVYQVTPVLKSYNTTETSAVPRIKIKTLYHRTVLCRGTIFFTS